MLVRILLIVVVLMLVHMLAATADAPQGVMQPATVRIRTLRGIGRESIYPPPIDMPRPWDAPGRTIMADVATSTAGHGRAWSGRVAVNGQNGS